jgi:hypothetical protein
MNLEEEITNELSQQMCSAIDFEILSDMLVKACGWHKIELIHSIGEYNYMDVSNWVAAFCKGKHMKHQRSYVFEDQGDAVNFTLRWVN